MRTGFGYILAVRRNNEGLLGIMVMFFMIRFMNCLDLQMFSYILHLGLEWICERKTLEYLTIQKPVFYFDRSENDINMQYVEYGALIESLASLVIEPPKSARQSHKNSELLCQSGRRITGAHTQSVFQIFRA